MIRVQLSPTQLVAIGFSRYKYKISPKGYTETFEREATGCRLYAGKPEDESWQLKQISMSILKRNYKDKPWSNEKRRVEALKLALDGSELSREDHAKVWSAYHSRPRVKSEPKPPTDAAPAAETGVVIPFKVKAIGAHAVVNKIVSEARVSIHDRSASELTH